MAKQFWAGKFLPSILEVHQQSPVRSHAGEEFAYILEGEGIITIGKKNIASSKASPLLSGVLNPIPMLLPTRKKSSAFCHFASTVEDDS